MLVARVAAVGSLVLFFVAAGGRTPQRHTREVIAQIRALSRAVRSAGGAGAARLRVAIDHEPRFLDAVGSVLLNPGGPLPARLERLDVAARRALAALGSPHGSRTGRVRALQPLRAAPSAGS